MHQRGDSVCLVWGIVVGAVVVLHVGGNVQVQTTAHGKGLVCDAQLLQVGMGKVKGLLMSDIADKYGGCVVARSFGSIDELLLQPWQACAVDGLKGGGLILDADDGLVLACG